MAITKTERRRAAIIHDQALLHSHMDASEAICYRKRLARDVASERRHGTRLIQVQEQRGARSTDQVVKLIKANMIGRNALFETPFGVKAQCYADFTGSGKPLQCVEDFVQRQVLPFYGNTHTFTSITGMQMTSFREDARHVIAQAVNAHINGPEPTDCVLFTGQGTTSAINKLVAMLDFARLGAHRDPEKRPVVFVGPFEHHSNLLPWRESGAKVVIIPENAADGKVCLATLTKELKVHAHRPVKIGAFSAASNLTGLFSDVDALSMVLHQHGALAFFDYSTCGPYVKINMNPKSPEAAKDAIFLSGHKFIGGPGSSGLLVVKTNLTGIRNAPTVPGGGTVLYVTHTDHRYLSKATDSDEGGIPDILGNIRLGLAFQIKQRVGITSILAMEKMNELHVHSSLTKNENIVLLGRNDDLKKLPIFSFLIRFGDRFLHYNFVCALLNDLFGIQTRGGCQCAGPYATQLLGITLTDLPGFKRALVEDQVVLKPGFTRMSFPYFTDANEVDHILRAVHFVANEGWKFLPQYRFEAESGSWTHILRLTASFELSHLSEFTTLIESMHMETSQHGGSCLRDEEPKFNISQHREENFGLARKLAILAMKSYSGALGIEPQTHLSSSHEPLRWFVYPQDAANMIKCGANPQLSTVIQGPFQPQRYASVRDSKLESSNTVEHQPEQQKRKKGLWGRSNSYPHESTGSSNFISNNGSSGAIFSKRAAVKTWVKRVFVRSHSSSSVQSLAVDFTASQVTI